MIGGDGPLPLVGWQLEQSQLKPKWICPRERTKSEICTGRNGMVIGRFIKRKVRYTDYQASPNRTGIILKDGAGNMEAASG